MIDVADPLLLVLFLSPLSRDVKYCLFSLDLEDTVEDLIAAVHSNDKDDDGEAIEVKGMLVIISK